MANRANVMSIKSGAVDGFVRLSFVALIGLFAGCAVMGAIGLDNAPINGRIVDTRDGKPIKGAFVIVRWSSAGAAVGHSKSSCPYLEIARSDVDGRYSFPNAPRADRDDYYRSVFAYVPGFQSDSERNLAQQHAPNGIALMESNIFMKPFVGTGDERIVQFRGFWSLASCGSEVQVPEKLAALYSALDDEVETLTLVRERAGRSPRSFTRLLDDLRRHRDEEANAQKSGATK
ncbi:MAG: carboxypeptidase regulatory-like domain-containing protein [Betaproteobacteria bacterium]|nr:carboxypeptidase regulatory-like domain-containing protein [Betaproteobacteria bacterium]